MCMMRRGEASSVLTNESVDKIIKQIHEYNCFMVTELTDEFPQISHNLL